MDIELLSLLVRFNCNQPSAPEVLENFQQTAGFSLPAEYVTWLRFANGGEGFIGDTYLILWRIEELIELNLGYRVAESAPELFIFGSDGGGEAFAFDRRQEMLIVVVPFIGMDLKNALPVAPRFSDFVRTLAGGWSLGSTSN